MIVYRNFLPAQLRIGSLLLSVFLLLILSCKINNLPADARISSLTGVNLYPMNADSPVQPIGHLDYNTSVTVVEETKSGYVIIFQRNRVEIWKNNIAFGEKPLVTFQYIKALQGGSIYNKPEGQVITLLPNQEKILCKGGKELHIKKLYAEYSESWIQVQSESGIKGWMRNIQLSEKPVNYYFASIARSGLNMRSAPSLQAPVSMLIPFKKTGRAFLRKSETFKVENITGSWMEVEFNGKKGWIFSGFALIGQSPDLLDNYEFRNLEYFQNLYKSYHEIPFINSENINIDSSLKKETTHMSGYELNVIQEPVSPDECSPEPISSLYIKKKDSDSLAVFKPGNGAYFKPGPLENSIELTQSGCRCCCPDISESLLFLLPDKIIAYPYHPVNQPGAGVCHFGPLYYTEFGQEIRKSEDGKTLYIDLRFPVCATELQDSSDPTVEIIYSDEFTSELFVKMHFPSWDNPPEIQRVFDKGIPEEFRNEWEAAIPAYKMPDQ